MKFSALLAALFCACAAWGDEARAASREFLGFRLLVLENQLARWNKASALTYAFVAAPTRFRGARNCGGMAPAEPLLARSRVTRARFAREVKAAFAMWENAVNVSFREIADPARADILIGAQTEPRGRAFTNVELDDDDASGPKGIRRALICLNPDLPWKVGFDGDLAVYDLKFTMAHEIGHAIGLDHPSPSGQLMSFRYDERHRALQPGDIAGAAALYGRRAPRVDVAGPRIEIPPSSVVSSRPRDAPALGLGGDENGAPDAR